MRNERENGFVLVLVIMAIALVGVMTFALTRDTQTMLFQSNMAYLRAVERNLATSGLLWAKQNLKEQSRQTFNEAVELDIGYMNIKEATLSVTVSSPTDRGAEVKVETSCSRGKRSLGNANTYKIRLP